MDGTLTSATDVTVSTAGGELIELDGAKRQELLAEPREIRGVVEVDIIAGRYKSRG